MRHIRTEFFELCALAQRDGLLALPDALLEKPMHPVLACGVFLVAGGMDRQLVEQLLYSGVREKGLAGPLLSKAILCIEGALLIQAGTPPFLCARKLEELACLKNPEAFLAEKTADSPCIAELLAHLPSAGTDRLLLTMMAHGDFGRAADGIKLRARLEQL